MNTNEKVPTALLQAQGSKWNRTNFSHVSWNETFLMPFIALVKRISAGIAIHSVAAYIY